MMCPKRTNERTQSADASWTGGEAVSSGRLERHFSPLVEVLDTLALHCWIHEMKNTR